MFAEALTYSGSERNECEESGREYLWENVNSLSNMVLFVSFRVFRWHKAFWNWNVSIHWRNQVIFRLTTMHTHTHSLVNKRIDTPHSSPYHIHTEEHMSGSFAFFGLCSVVAVGVNGMIFLFAKKRCRYFICLCWLANTRLYGSVFMIEYISMSCFCAPVTKQQCF